MSARCVAGCGDCCDPVETGWPLARLVTQARRWLAGPDPEADYAGFVAHCRATWPDWDGDVAEAVLRRAATLANYEFVLAHWTQVAGPAPEWWPRQHVYECDAFDPSSRTCTAHADRPPICSGYPWYGKEPEATDKSLQSPRCAFNADIPGRSLVGVLIPVTPL